MGSRPTTGSSSSSTSAGRTSAHASWVFWRSTARQLARQEVRASREAEPVKPAGDPVVGARPVRAVRDRHELEVLAHP